MAFNVEAPEYLEHVVPDFGIFHLNIEQASELVAKILCLEGQLDVAAPENLDEVSLNTPQLVTLLDKHIKTYAAAITAGVANGSLKAARISRRIDDTVIPGETYIDVWVLAEWLAERNTEIQGDWLEDYAEGEFRVSEAAGQAVRLERHRIKEGRSRDDTSSPDEKIAALESEVLALRALVLRGEPRRKPVKPLHTKERETLLKMVIGMARDGYGYDPDTPRSPFHRELADILADAGTPLDEDTVRKWLKEAAELLPGSTDDGPG